MLGKRILDAWDGRTLERIGRGHWPRDVGIQSQARQDREASRWRPGLKSSGRREDVA